MVIPIVSGSVSFIASFTLVVMILMSADKLKTPLRRLIFGLSVSDVIASISTILNPLMLPEGEFLAYGNQGTCEAVAFSNHIGVGNRIDVIYIGFMYILFVCD